jgi:hypothetical protein
MWLQGVSFFWYRRCFLPKCYFWRKEMVKHGRITCIIMCHMSSCACWWPRWPIFGGCSYSIILYVLWVIYEGYHYVDLWSMFWRLAYGMFYITIKGSTKWKKVLPLGALCKLKYLIIYLNSRNIILSFPHDGS